MTPLERVASMIKTSSQRADGTLTHDGNNNKGSNGLTVRREVKFSALDESAKKAAPKLYL
jgi:hypothetical protein